MLAMIREATNVTEGKKGNSLTHSFAVVKWLSHTDTSQTMRFSEEDVQISRVNALPCVPSSVMVYSQSVLHFPENCSTP
jgi:hypothetical protein